MKQFSVSKAIRPLLLGCLALAIAQGAEWQIEIADAGVGGQFTSLRIDKFGNGHVAYLDDAQGILKYAFWDHTLNKWFATPLDRSGGFCSLALDSKQRPHISYIEYGTGKLKYAHWTGTAWLKEAVLLQAKEVSFYTSITLVGANDYPSITFYEYFDASGDNNLRLRNVAWNGSYWEVRTVDSAPGSGKFNFVASDSAGNPHIAYGNVKYENASLRYASWDGHSWRTEILEGAGKPGTSMWSVSLLMDKNDQPHIAYTDVINRLIKYATRSSGSWTTEVVDSLAKEGYPDRNGIALDEQGNPYVSYYDAGAGLLKVAHRKAGKWIVEVVDQNFAGYTSSLQIHTGTIYLTYEDENGRSLKFAHRPIEQPGQLSEQKPASGDKEPVAKK
jgi:hypothetical protein